MSKQFTRVEQGKFRLLRLFRSNERQGVYQTDGIMILELVTILMMTITMITMTIAMMMMMMMMMTTLMMMVTTERA